VGGGSIGTMGKGAVIFVTLCVSGDVWWEFMIVVLTTIVAWGGDAKAGGTLSSCVGRLVVSLIGEGLGEGDRFEAFCSGEANEGNVVDGAYATGGLRGCGAGPDDGRGML